MDKILQVLTILFLSLLLAVGIFQMIEGVHYDVAEDISAWRIDPVESEMKTALAEHRINTFLFFILPTMLLLSISIYTFRKKKIIVFHFLFLLITSLLLYLAVRLLIEIDNIPMRLISTFASIVLTLAFVISLKRLAELFGIAKTTHNST